MIHSNVVTLSSELTNQAAILDVINQLRALLSTHPDYEEVSLTPEWRFKIGNSRTLQIRYSDGNNTGHFVRCEPIGDNGIDPLTYYYLISSVNLPVTLRLVWDDYATLVINRNTNTFIGWLRDTDDAMWLKVSDYLFSPNNEIKHTPVGGLSNFTTQTVNGKLLIFPGFIMNDLNLAIDNVTAPRLFWTSKITAVGVEFENNIFKINNNAIIWLKD